MRGGVVSELVRAEEEGGPTTGHTWRDTDHEIKKHTHTHTQTRYMEMLGVIHRMFLHQLSFLKETTLVILYTGTICVFSHGVCA